MATIHNPTNFNPADYEIIDTLDNRRPQYYGQGIEAWQGEIAWYEREMKGIYGPDWVKKIHHCVHCGNGNVRWITAVRHLPTNDVVTFGCDCTERLGFANRQDWKLVQLKSKAEAGHQRIKVWKLRVAYLEQHPEIAQAIEQVKEPLHADNRFVKDVLSKLDTYGYLTERQAAAIPTSLARDVERQTQQAKEAVEVKGDAPSGRQTVTGVIVGLKTVEGYMGGETLKMVVKLQNNSRVYATVPSAALDGNELKGRTIIFTATFEASKDDKSFAFGKRPTLIDIKEGA